MWYVMIDKNYEIVNTIEAESLNHAEEYFVSRKQFVDKDTFDSLYKVLSKQEYNLIEALKINCKKTVKEILKNVEYQRNIYFHMEDH